ncbi:acyltransferase family protein [Mucilaginibacter segetis]|uniref:Acyltransferase n=1 Tax=Mucilaginibacter segetis TaxID=2793071 RepID=A0A934PU24_9SPHI|nr:acyltransferase [Mucilaginibacter segetis]MBK0379018.1 acyltransferase [Mucilaginibacter segetis]
MGSENAVSDKKRSYVYFPNLDGIRAIAALMVVVSHIEYHKNLFNLQRIGIPNLQNMGKVGVTIFFALSGFLITYLLMVEKGEFNRVGLKDFYIRRILRIWPLYFLIVIVGFFVYPRGASKEALWLSVFFMPNLAFCLQMLPSIFDPIWSIGTEEQFYIFHPHIFRIKKPENILYALVGITLALITINIIVRSIQNHNQFLSDLSLFLYYARFHNMMVGAIVAVLYYNTKHPSFKFKLQSAFELMFNKYVQIVIWICFILFVYLYTLSEIPQGDIVISVLAALIIVNLCETSSSIFSLNNSKLKYCGKISYGIYLLHKYPLYLMLYIAQTYLSSVGLFWQNLFIYVATLIAVIALASLSYYGFERYFLRFKSRFQKVSQNKQAVSS